MKTQAIHDVIERLHAVGDKHDRIMATIAIEQLDKLTAELERLQAIEAAARGVLDSFMITDTWDDEAGTPAREEAIGDMHRDQRLEALASLLERNP